jgi:hypothetical protein
MEDGGWSVEGGEARMEGEGARMEDGGWRMEGGGWRRAGTRLQKGGPGDKSLNGNGLGARFRSPLSSCGDTAQQAATKAELTTKNTRIAKKNHISEFFAFLCGKNLVGIA